MKITAENFAEGAYRRGITWDVFDTGRGVEIQRMDNVEHPDTNDLLEAIFPGEGNPWFADDDEAFIMVCFLALDGEEDALLALSEIGCTKETLNNL